MLINILLLNWNSSDDISICIKNIIQSKMIEYRIILIDNDSKKSDQQKLEQVYREYENKINIHLVINDSNYGYAGGNNRGYEYLKKQELDGDILILNPDIQIAENTLFEMKNTLDSDENIGAVMSRTLTVDHDILYDYIKMDGFRQKWLKSDDDLVDTDYVAGSCMLLRRKTIDQIGLFDEKYFMYWEEVDLSFRIKNIGYKLVSTTNTYIIRKENSTNRSINAIYYYIRNTFYLKQAYRLSNWQHLVFLLFSLLSQFKNGFSYGQLKLRLNKYFNGIVDGYQHYKILKKR